MFIQRKAEWNVMRDAPPETVQLTSVVPTMRYKLSTLLFLRTTFNVFVVDVVDVVFFSVDFQLERFRHK